MLDMLMRRKEFSVMIMTHLQLKYKKILFLEKLLNYFSKNKNLRTITC